MYCMFGVQSLSIANIVVTSCGQSQNAGYTHFHSRLAPPTGTAIELVTLSFEPQSNRCWAAQTIEVWTDSRAGKFPMICCFWSFNYENWGAVPASSGSDLRCPTNEQPQKRPGDERNINRWFMNQNLPDLNLPLNKWSRHITIYHIWHIHM